MDPSAMPPPRFALQLPSAPNQPQLSSLHHAPTDLSFSPSFSPDFAAPPPAMASPKPNHLNDYTRSNLKSSSSQTFSHPIQSKEERKTFRQKIKSEIFEIKSALINLFVFLKNHDYRSTIKKSTQRKYWAWWVLTVVVIILSALLSSYHHKITVAIRPYQQQIRNSPAAWIVPTVLLIIVSFPPLMGHEIIILLSGMIWGTWIGFGIACAGTFLGEIATYFAFKYLIRKRSEEIETKSITYASLARLMREGGLVIVILVRASALPGHITTAIQASIGISFWIFTVACFVTLPKQFAIVYLGVLLGEGSPTQNVKTTTNDQMVIEIMDQNPTPEEQGTHHLISVLVFLVTILFTLVSAYLVWMRMRTLRPVVEEEFKARKISLARIQSDPSTIHTTDQQEYHHLGEKLEQDYQHSHFKN